MLQFGCDYDEPSEKCFRTYGTHRVDSKCNLIGNECNTINPNKMNMSKSVSYSPVPSHTQTPRFVNLSGAVSAYSTEYLGKKYYFFGDAHFYMNNTCSPPCDDYDLDTLLITKHSAEGLIHCYDITVLINNIIENNGHSNKYVDVYLETDFYPRGSKFPTSEVVKSSIEDVGYIQKIFYIYRNCFEKINCPYKNARFHYIDIRVNGEIEYPVFYPFFTGELYSASKKIINSTGDVREAIHIELTDKLITRLFKYTNAQFSPKQPIIIQLFNLYLTSDDYTNDVFMLFNNVFQLIPEGRDRDRFIEAVYDPLSTVKRNGKTMHRIRAQFYALEQDGKKELAGWIINYIMSKYIEEMYKSQIVVFWDKLMEEYRSGFGRKYTNLELLDHYDYPYTFSTDKDVPLIMDAYFLARLFRTYSKTNRNHMDSSCSIVYAGFVHIRTYVDFFKHVLGTNFKSYENPLDVSESAVSRCLKVDLNDFQ